MDIIEDKYNIKNSFVPVTLGGDQSITIGSIARASSDVIGVIWFNTHADCNTNKTTLAFNIHGYPLASSLGDGQDEFTKLYNNKTKYENGIENSINEI